MKIGLSRFIYFTDQIKALLKKAGKEKDPAMWLFTNNARTPFFMLEGLARIYSKMHNPKKFDKLNEHFKLMEDGFGQIDHYNSLSVEFRGKKVIPADNKLYIKTKLDQSVRNLNQVLEEKNWLSDNDKRIKKITRKLKDADWMDPDDEIKAISDIYKSYISGITKFVNQTNFHFDNVEKDVHELRRKLRWLSIYPQALQGAIQYAPATRSAAHLKKYLTEEIVNSPFNKLPPAGNNTSFLLLHKKYYLALSWMIARLGNIKDEGLLLIGMSESLKQTTACTEEEALLNAEVLLGRKQRKLQLILADAEDITKTYISENNLQRLISKIVP